MHDLSYQVADNVCEDDIQLPVAVGISAGQQSAGRGEADHGRNVADALGCGRNFEGSAVVHSVYNEVDGIFAGEFCYGGLRAVALESASRSGRPGAGQSEHVLFVLTVLIRVRVRV